MKRLLLSLFLFLLNNNLGAYLVRIANTASTLSRCTSTKTFSPIIQQHVDQTIHHFKIRNDILEKSYQHFAEIPGYQDLLDSIKSCYENPHYLKGFLFELEAALTLCEQSDSTIEKFHYIMHRPNSTIASDAREIDVLSNHHATECKYHAWKHVNQSNLRKQLGHQHSILKDHNNYYGTRYKHLFYSKNTIPNNVKQWLIDHNIEYRELSESINAYNYLDVDI